MNPGTIVGILGALSLAISACDTAGDLTDAGARVRFGGAAPENALCQELGIVYGSDGGLGESSEEKMRTAQNKIRNRAAAAGGNFVLLDLSASDRTGYTLSGRALHCTARPARVMPVARSAPPAPPVTAAPTPEQRIRTLDDLHQKGLITDDEYQQRRNEILESL